MRSSGDRAVRQAVPGRPQGGWHGMDRRLSLRRGSVSGERRSDPGGQLSLRDVPAVLRRRLHDLRALPGGAPSHGPARSRPLPLLGRCRARVLRLVRQHAVDAGGDPAGSGPGQPRQPRSARPDPRPDDHVWTKSQLPWLEVVDHLPRFPTISAAVPRAPGRRRRASGGRFGWPAGCGARRSLRGTGVRGGVLGMGRTSPTQAADDGRRRRPWTPAAWGRGGAGRKRALAMRADRGTCALQAWLWRRPR